MRDDTLKYAVQLFLTNKTTQQCRRTVSTVEVGASECDCSEPTSRLVMTYWHSGSF